MLRVLSIEDDLIMQDMIAATLETKGGYRVDFADTGAQGLTMLTEGLRKFDCLLIDVNLPDMTGIEFTERARALRGYDETPMIVVTKSDDEATIVRHLRNLHAKSLSTDLLSKTGIGKVVGGLRKHDSAKVKAMAGALVKKWKAMVSASQ